jgi:hypothetical protein
VFWHKHKQSKVRLWVSSNHSCSVPFLSQATDALYEVLVGNKLRAAMFRLFPQLLVTLLIQIHHSIGLTMSDVSIPSGLYAEKELSTEVTPLWYCTLSFH